MNIHLDGGEVSIIKALGFSGAGLAGDTLAARVQGMEEAELVDALQGLIAVGYVSCEGGIPKRPEDLRKMLFQVNSGYAREIKEALDPSPKKVQKPRRMRRE